MSAIPDTSLEAYLSLDGKAISKQKAKILYLIDRAGDLGQTCDEIEWKLQEGTHQGISARIRELVQANAIIDSGKRRDTRTGRKARIYVMKPKEEGDLFGLPLRGYPNKWEKPKKDQDREDWEAVLELMKQMEGYDEVFLIECPNSWDRVRKIVRRRLGE